MQAENTGGQTVPSGPPRTARTATPRVSLLACGLVLIGATAGVFLAGGPTQGSLGVFLLCAGAALLICPPQQKVGWPLWSAAGVLMGCGTLAFLPERWFGVPGWRQQLEAAPAIHLPTSVTPVPWETSFWLAILGLSILVGFFCLAHPVRSVSLLAFAVVATVVTAMYAALGIYVKQSGWHYPFDGGATFGFFPNRNHTAALLETGSIVAIGVLGVVLRDRRWIVASLTAASLTVNISALFFYSGSRGGVVFLVVGALIWVAGLGRTARDPRLLVSVATLAIAGAVLLFVSGSEVRHRLFARGERPASERAANAEENIPLDFRTLVYRDTRGLIRDFPLTGTGLGAFAGDFAHYRHASLTESAALHPESDWLMLVAEAGIPALVCAAGLLGLLLLRLRGQASHPYWPLRWGCAVAAGTAVLHGLVDVPLHRVNLGWWVLILAGLGLQVGAGKSGERSRAQHLLFILGGLGALMLGTRLVRAEWFGATALPPFAAERAPQVILARYEKDAFDAMNMAGQATRVSPMAAPLYSLWGVMMLHFEDSSREVDEAFQAERLLNPNWTQVPLLEGDAWAYVDSKRAAALWLDALDRKCRIDHATIPLGTSDSGPGYFRELLVRSNRWPVASGELVTAAARGPAYALAWLEGVAPAVVRLRMADILTNDTLLSRFSLPERQRLLLLWDAKGDPDALAGFLEAHPEWKLADWPLRLRRLVAANRQEEAVHTAVEHYRISLNLPIPTRPGADSTASNEPTDAVAQFNRHWNDGNTVTARRVLAEAADPGGDSSWAAEYWRLRLTLAVQDQNWQQAWQFLQRYVRQTRPEEVMP